MDSSNTEFDDSVRRATRWALGANLSSQALTVAVLATLCRLVAPDQFGVFGAALLVVAFPRTIATVGFSAAIVQRHELSSAQTSSLFWLSAGAGVACGIASALAGVLLGVWGDSRALAELTVALAGTSIVASLGMIHQGLLERRMALPAVQRARIVAQAAASLAAIGAAWQGWQAWALVVQQYVELAVFTVLVWRCERWRPARPARGVGARGLVRFSSSFALANLIFYVGQNSDKLLLYVAQGATVAGQASLGMYTLAYNLMMRPVYLVTTPMTSVMLPALSRAAVDPVRYAELVRRLVRMCGILLLPAGAGLWLVAPDASLVLAGPDWQATGGLLRALAPVVLVQGFINICGTVLSSVGRMRQLLLGSIVVSIVLIQGYATGFWLGGMYGVPLTGPTLGVAWGYSLVSVGVLFGPYLLFCLAQVGIRWREAFGPLLGPLAATCGMSVFVWCSQQTAFGTDAWPAVVRLVVQVSVGAAAYVWLARRDVAWLYRQLRGNTSRS